MQPINLVMYPSYDSAGEYFPVCDLDEGGDFMDPLILFDLPGYDVMNVNKEGLVAIGGNIDIATLEKSYKWGIFPWFAYRVSEPNWFCPPKRYVINPQNLHVGHSLRNLMNKKKYRITENERFEDVIRHCRTVDSRSEHPYAWLSKKIEDVFIELNKTGYARSVELWEGDKLAGGFYGFWYNGVLQGESMFSLQPSASQIALIMFCQKGTMDGRPIKFIDTQYETPTFKRLGGSYMDYREYRRMFNK